MTGVDGDLEAELLTPRAAGLESKVVSMVRLDPSTYVMFML